MSSAVRPDRQILLVLPAPRGERTTLRLTAGMERFIGRYALIPEFASAGMMLEFRDAG